MKQLETMSNENIINFINEVLRDAVSIDRKITQATNEVSELKNARAELERDVIEFQQLAQKARGGKVTPQTATDITLELFDIEQQLKTVERDLTELLDSHALLKKQARSIIKWCNRSRRVTAVITTCEFEKLAGYAIA